MIAIHSRVVMALRRHTAVAPLRTSLSSNNRDILTRSRATHTNNRNLPDRVTLRKGATLLVTVRLSLVLIPHTRPRQTKALAMDNVLRKASGLLALKDIRLSRSTTQTVQVRMGSDQVYREDLTLPSTDSSSNNNSKEHRSDSLRVAHKARKTNVNPMRTHGSTPDLDLMATRTVQCQSC